MSEERPQRHGGGHGEGLVGGDDEAPAGGLHAVTVSARDERSLLVLFVSGVSVGGSLRSTTELARAFADRGLGVGLLVGLPAKGPIERLFRLGVSAWVKLGGTGWAARAVRGVLRPFGRRLRPMPSDRGVRTWGSPVPENALRAAIRAVRPDVVVVSSVRRAAWRWIRADLATAGIASVLYVREEHAVTHLTVSGAAPDLLLANAEAHATRLRERGHDCVVVPSIIDRTAAEIESSRRVVVLVNPVAANRIDLVAQLARARPDVPFVLQESWPLADADRRGVLALAGEVPNVEVRSPVDRPALVYRDAKVLLATYPSGRPRVVAEAQHNGIPVLAAATPELIEAVGDGGVLVPPDAPVEAWTRALSGLWDDKAAYDRLAAAARAHDGRVELDPDHAVDRVEAALRALIRR